MSDKPKEFTHLDGEGRARMVDVSSKTPTLRTALARGRIKVYPAVLDKLLRGDLPKGDALAAARIAGIMAAKRVPELIPLCHPLQITSVAVDFRRAGPGAVEITARARALDVTGVEMEALTAVSVAALTIYDMCKALDKSMEIGSVELVEKTGGKSGTYRKPED